MFNSVFKALFLFAAIAMVAVSCTKKITTVLVEDPAGNVELIYAGSQMPEDLVKEIRYYPNGDTMSVTPMLKSEVNGIVRAYHKGNIRKEEVTFVKGVQDGWFRSYDKEGILVFEGNLKNGRKDGVWTTWYDDVQMAEQRNYLEDQADGKWTYWFIDGNLKREEVYKLGKLIEEKNFN